MAISTIPWTSDDPGDAGPELDPVFPRLWVLPGTYRAQADSFLVGRSVRRLAPGRRVLDVCTGSGALAVVAAAAGADRVVAVDLSSRSVLNARLNAARHRLAVEVRRGNLFAPVRGQRFDLVVCNPPYVPSATDVLPRHTAARAWDGGTDGRAVVDRFCAEVGEVLAREGRVLLVHPSFIGVTTTLACLAAGGLSAAVVARLPNPFGPVLRSRERALRQRALLAEDERHETLVVFEARACASARTAGCR